MHLYTYVSITHPHASHASMRVIISACPIHDIIWMGSNASIALLCALGHLSHEGRRLCGTTWRTVLCLIVSRHGCHTSSSSEGPEMRAGDPVGGHQPDLLTPPCSGPSTRVTTGIKGSTCAPQLQTGGPQGSQPPLQCLGEGFARPVRHGTMRGRPFQLRLWVITPVGHLWLRLQEKMSRNRPF